MQGEEGELTINNEEIEVNASNKFGVFVPILERMFGQLDISFRIHKRVHVVLFILQHRETSQDNKDISKFMNVLIQWIKRKYKTEGIYDEEMDGSIILVYCGHTLVDGKKLMDYPLDSMKRKWPKPFAGMYVVRMF